MKIINPVLTGFHADPAIVRVKDTYYIANSTFEWFPGVRIHESKDLIHWKLVSLPLIIVKHRVIKTHPIQFDCLAPWSFNLFGNS